jgi:hypothetical protein
MPDNTASFMDMRKGERRRHVSMARAAGVVAWPGIQYPRDDVLIMSASQIWHGKLNLSLIKLRRCLPW